MPDDDFTLRLPAELLLRIYYFNTLRSINIHSCRMKQGFHNIIPPPLRNALNASQVCRRWRALVLAEPNLWRYSIPLHHPRREWVELLLERSKPFSITYAQSRLCRHQFFQSVELSHAREALGADRLLSYQIHLTRAWRDEVWPNTPNSWPRLEFLCVDTRDANLLPGDLRRGLWGRTLSDFPGLATPVLKRLHLHDCTVENISQIAVLGDTLTSLRIENPPLASMPSVKGWLDVLKQLLRLKDLVLVRAVRPSTNYRTQPEAHLASSWTVRLNEFQLEDTLPVCNQFLSQLILAESCTIFSLRVCLTLFPDVGTVRSLCSLLSPIVADTSRKASLQSCAAGLHGYEVTCVDLANRYRLQGPASIQDTPPDEGDISALNIRFSFHRNIANDVGMIVSQMLHDLFQPFHAKAVVLGIPGIDIVDEAMPYILRKWGCYAKSLDFLTLPAWNAVFHAFPPPVTVNPSCTNTSTEATLLPNLQHLRFDRRPESNEGVRSNFHNDLIWFCKYRQITGYPIQTIWHVPANAATSDRGKATSSADVAVELKELGIHLVR